MSTKTENTVTWHSVFPNPDDIGTSEYRSIADTCAEQICDASSFTVDDNHPLTLEEIELGISIAEAYIENAEMIRGHLLRAKSEITGLPVDFKGPRAVVHVEGGNVSAIYATGLPEGTKIEVFDVDNLRQECLQWEEINEKFRATVEGLNPIQ